MSQLKEKVQLTVQQIKITSELFYQQKNNEAYKQLNETIGLVSNLLNELYVASQENNDLQFKQDIFHQILEDAMNAMQEKDTVLLADILQYDLIEKFEEIIKKM